MPNLVRLSAISPFLEALEERGFSARRFLLGQNLPPEISASSDIFIAISIMYKLIESIADFVDDVHIGFNVGRTTDLNGYSLVRTSMTDATTIGSLLVNLVRVSPSYGAVRHTLRCDHRRASIEVERPIDVSVPTAQCDAFVTAVLHAILNRALGEAFDAGKILAQVCDPEVIPETWEGRVSQGKHPGPVFSFPTE